MEIIRRRTDYGIRALMHMSLMKSETGIFGAREIAEAREVPEVYMQKVLHALAEAGIVQSHRGVFGGFSLLKQPDEITILSLMETLQGPVAINKCVLKMDLCPREKECLISEGWCKVQSSLVEFLGGITLKDLLQDYAAQKLERGSVAGDPSIVIDARERLTLQ